MSSRDTRVIQSDRVDPAAATVVEGRPRAPDGITPGALLVNTYRVQRMLGDGGMGEVYLTRHAGLGTEHAVKVIRPELAREKQVMDLFYREARVLRGVRNDAVVSYDGFVRDDQGRDYLVMEYADGPSLADRLESGPLTSAEVLVLRDRLASGLAEAHRRGAVHRDISPDNVILCGGRIESAKLIDFGICKLTDPGQETIIGDAFAGKLRYASPEQLGLFDGHVDARTDVYSLGLILAAAAIGRPLDMGSNFSSATRARERLPDLSAVPAELRDWLSAMLEPDPARRVPSMEALMQRWPARGGTADGGGESDQGESGSARRLHWRLGLWVPVVLAASVGLYIALRPVPDGPDDVVVPSGQTGHAITPAAHSTPVDSGARETERSESTVPDGTGQAQVSSEVPSEDTKAEDGATEAPASTDRPVQTSTPPSIAALTADGRLDDALALAQQQLDSDSPPPADALWPLVAALRGAGRLDDAFFLARKLLKSDDSPPADVLWPLARALRDAGRLDPAFAVARELARRGHGEAAYLIARMYDPVDWSSADSPFGKSNAKKARQWYRVAVEAGVSAARERLEQLTAGAGGQ